MYNYTYFKREMEHFRLEKPNLKEIDSKAILEAILGKNGSILRKFIDDNNSPEYLYWDKAKYKQPIPEKLSREQLWAATKFIREINSIKSVVRDETGNYYTWFKLMDFEKFYHDIDMATGGELFVVKADFDKITKQKLITRGTMEEAIASSQLEGASTSRAMAKKFLREGRKPRNASEQMILNNYLSIKALEEDYKDKEMSLGLLYELHGMITKDTLTPEGETPRLRNDGEPIFVVDKLTGIVYHKAPKMSFVKPELERFISFANNKMEHEFIHPVVKAIMMHFWIGYLHPFTDGNGRLARLIFYWYLLKHEYWAFSYLPISKIIKKAPEKYAKAYLYSENDDYDMTYFIDFNIRKIKAAVNEFRGYLEKRMSGNRQMTRKAQSEYDLNERQIQLLQHLQGDPDSNTSLKVHMNVYRVSKMTALSDLKKLAALKLLESRKAGRNVYYYATERIKDLFV